MQGCPRAANFDEDLFDLGHPDEHDRVGCRVGDQILLSAEEVWHARSSSSPVTAVPQDSVCVYRSSDHGLGGSDLAATVLRTDGTASHACPTAGPFCEDVQ